MERLFINAAPADARTAESVAGVLESAGYDVRLPQRGGAANSVLSEQQAALENGGRIVLLVSAAALADDLWTAGWQSVLANDPHDAAHRLIVLRIEPCALPQRLSTLTSWNVEGREPERQAHIVLQAVGRPQAPLAPAGGETSAAEAHAPDAGPNRLAGPALPAGTVTFVFTAIDGSAERWLRDRAAMDEALVRHDAIVRAAITEHGGFPFKNLGDGMRAAFARSEDAAAAALDIQYRLRAQDFRAVDGLPVRIAIHAGNADERGGDYTGRAVERTARLLDAGFGGQILLSGAAAQLVRARLPEHAELLDLGEHRLGDALQPQSVYQLNAPQLPAAFPPVRSRNAVNHNLPPELTSFVGRESQIAEIAALLAEQRFVTLLGAGGIGKTRTALAVAADFAGPIDDGVWFIDFAPLAGGAYLAAEIAAVLGVREEHDRPLLGAIIEHLRERRLLLIFDNCEHVLDDARTAVETTVRGCPNVSILATSRELLGATGEIVYRLPTLAVPAETGSVSAAQALAYEAVTLFTARAQTASAKFSLTDANAGTVAAICRRLDGIALAIELAAARVAIMNVADISAKLGERFRLLKGGSRAALPRQQTLRALIDWSYDLLDADQQRLFRRLSTFAGGWTLEAATAVCGDAGSDEFTILDGLTSLADKSLVVVDDADDARRFRFLESMRVYALERAREAGEAEELARRRAAFFVDFAGYGQTVSVDIVARITALAADLENLREVLRWALEEANDIELGGRLACALGRFWSTRLPREGERWLRLAQTRLPADADRALTAEIANALAAMLPHGSGERFTATEQALAANREVGEPAKLTKALAAYGEQLAPLGRVTEANAAYEEALALARQIRSDWDAARALAGLTMIAVDRADLGLAREHGQAAIALFDAIKAIDGVAYVSIALCDAEFMAGNADRAFALAQRARAAYGEVQNQRSSAGAAIILASLSLIGGDVDAARAHARDALEVLGSDYHPMFFPEAVAQLGHVATLRGDFERGALLFGYNRARRRAISHQLGGSALERLERHTRALAAALDADTLERYAEAGGELSEAGARELALSV